MLEIGIILSKIAQYQFSEVGFFNQELKVIPYKKDEITDFMKNCLHEKIVLTVLSTEMILEIHNIIEKYTHLLLNLKETNLVHGDFDPANIMVDKVNGEWKVSGILDWEFASSGSYLWDVANMLRYAHKMPFEFQNSFIKGLKKGGIHLPQNWYKIILIMNLSALLDCLKRSEPLHLHQNRCTDIYELIKYILNELNS